MVTKWQHSKYTNVALSKPLVKPGVKHEFSAPSTAQHNGLAERVTRDITVYKGQFLKT